MGSGGVDEARRRSFDEAADAYDEARPGYPEELIEVMIRYAGLGARGRVLEIGCGTGQATLPLARRGLDVLCLEPGERLAAVAERNLAAWPAVRIVRAYFEEWEPEGGPFRLVVAAQSLHHVEPDVRYAKTARVLEPGGALAMLGNLPGTWDPALRARFDRAYERWDPEEARESRWPLARRIADSRKAIEDSGFFRDVEVHTHAWAPVYDTARYLRLLDTYSGHRKLTPEARAGLYADIRAAIDHRGGTIENPLVAALFIGRMK